MQALQGKAVLGAVLIPDRTNDRERDTCVFRGTGKLQIDLKVSVLASVLE